MKQNSIDYLIEKLEGIIIEGNQLVLEVIIDHAKQMHKQEIIEATKYGNSFEQGDLRCETYYKNTYEKEN